MQRSLRSALHDTSGRAGTGPIEDETVSFARAFQAGRVEAGRSRRDASAGPVPLIEFGRETIREPQWFPPAVACREGDDPRLRIRSSSRTPGEIDDVSQVEVFGDRLQLRLTGGEEPAD
jgi:hypothetical protein